MSYETWALKRDIGRLERNQLSRTEWLDRHAELCNTALELGPDSIKDLAESLLRRATDDRALISAALEVKRTSGWTLGPRDDTPLSELSLSDICGDCRYLRDLLRAGAYRPGTTHRFRVPKFPTGHRTIQLADFEDRIVAKAAQLVLDPLVDPTLLNCSYGFRRRRSRFQALARMRELVGDGYHVAIAVDIRKAFDVVPNDALNEILRKRVPSEKFVDHLANLLGLDHGVGVPQGNPLSPVMLNLYANHRIDRPWTDNYPEWPLIRYADDLLVLTRSHEEGIEALRRLDRLTTSACLRLKDATPSVVTNLGDSQGFDWLGHHLNLEGSELKISLRSDEAARLAFKLKHRRQTGESDRKTRHRVFAWARSRGPAYNHETADEFIDVVTHAMDSAGIALEMADHRLLRYWELGFEQWVSVIERQQKNVLDAAG